MKPEKPKIDIAKCSKCNTTKVFPNQAKIKPFIGSNIDNYWSFQNTEDSQIVRCPECPHPDIKGKKYIISE